ncbi:hypothetical protein D3C72_2150940 [compost metagenome]
MSAEICRRSKLPPSRLISPMASAGGRLVTVLTMPPGAAAPYSTDDGPRNTSTRSRPYGSCLPLYWLIMYRMPSR